MPLEVPVSIDGAGVLPACVDLVEPSGFSTCGCAHARLYAKLSCNHVPLFQQKPHLHWFSPAIFLRVIER